MPEEKSNLTILVAWQSGAQEGATKHEEASVTTWINVNCEREARGNWNKFAVLDWIDRKENVGVLEKKKGGNGSMGMGMGPNPIQLGKGSDRIIQDEGKKRMRERERERMGFNMQILVSQILSALNCVTPGWTYVFSLLHLSAISLLFYVWAAPGMTGKKNMRKLQ